MKRVLKLGCLTSILAILTLAALLAWQLSQLSEASRSPSPLAIEVPGVAGQKTQSLRATLRMPRTGSAKLGVPSAQLNYALQISLARPEVLALIDQGLTEADQALKSGSDPFGVLEDLDLDRLDVARLRASLRIVESTLQLRMTAPYDDGSGHLNLAADLVGRWNRGEANLDVRRLRVGNKDVLELPLYGWLLRRAIEEALDEGLKRAASDGQEPMIDSAWLDADHLYLLPRADAGPALRQLLTKTIFGQ